MSYENYYNKMTIVGILFIILGLVILKSDFIDSYVTTILWPILEGSSEGKTVLFCGILGSLFILMAPLKLNKDIQERLKLSYDKCRRYFIYSMVVMFVCAVIGIIIEFHLRRQFNVSFFTILSTLDPACSTTSPIHSHVYKSVLGVISEYIVPSHINTGISLLQYVFPYSLVVIILWPISYIFGLLATAYMRTFHKIALAFFLTVALIGLIDGGLFSQPFLIGLGFLELVYFSKEDIGLKYFKKPLVIMAVIVFIGLAIEIGGSDSTEHTLTVINQTEPVDMSSYDVTSVTTVDDKTIYVFKTDVPDKVLILEIFEKFKNKSSLTFMSWDFYTYI